jgi:hypothetical protein
MNHRWISGTLLAAVLVFPAFAQQDGAPCCKGMHSGPDNTPGWSMMSPQERKDHHAKMEGFKSGDECKAYMAEHHAQMSQRAKERGKKMHEPRHSMCEPMKRGSAKQ